MAALLLRRRGLLDKGAIFKNVVQVILPWIDEKIRTNLANSACTFSPCFHESSYTNTHCVDMLQKLALEIHECKEETSEFRSMAMPFSEMLPHYAGWRVQCPCSARTGAELWSRHYTEGRPCNCQSKVRLLLHSILVLIQHLPIHTVATSEMAFDLSHLDWVWIYKLHLTL